MKKRRAAISMLPSILTLCNIGCGFMAISLLSEIEYSSNYRFVWAAWLIIGGMVFDMLDGRVARLMNELSEFGAQLDSLADMVTFCVAPALLSGQMFRVLVTHPDHPRMAWIFSSIFTICGALRLARYNAERHDDENGVKHFEGLPSPAAAGVMASLTLVFIQMLNQKEFESIAIMQKSGYVWIVKAMPLIAMTCGLLMVSRFKYPHVANQFLGKRQPFMYLVAFIFLLMIFATIPQLTLLILFSLFALTAPVTLLIAYLRGSLTEEESQIF